MDIEQEKKADVEHSKHNMCMICSRGVVPGDAGGAMAPPDFGRSGNPISTRGTDYAHLITTSTPGFSDLPTALCSTYHIPQTMRTFLLNADVV